MTAGRVGIARNCTFYLLPQTTPGFLLQEADFRIARGEQLSP
jgi:hypothetical protein